MYIDIQSFIPSLFKPGDRVYVTQSLTGTYAEYSLCDENSIHKLPDSVSYSQGAALGVPYYTAYRALIHRSGSESESMTRELVLNNNSNNNNGLCSKIQRYIWLFSAK